jgi:hypothetical protein
MPTIAVFPDPFRAYNRVEVNWADLPGVEYAQVLRVDVETGECTPLRPYVCYEGDYLKLSCGHGIFWDTEVPLDRQVYYITEGLGAPCIPDPAQPDVVFDDYGRVVADSFGTATSGQIYSVYSGPLTQYDVTGTEATITPDTLGTNRYGLLDVGTANYTAQVTLTTNTLPTGGNIGAYGLVTRWVDDNNYIRTGVSVTTTGLVTVFITRVIAGVATVSSIASPYLLTASDLKLGISVDGPMLKAKVWPIANPEPATWDIEVTDHSLLTSSMLGLIARRDAGNVTPTILAFDDLIVPNTCTTCTPVTADTSADPTTMPSNGAFRLRDPVRPCNDIYMPLCFTQSQVNPDCIPGTGVFFASMDTEVYEPNTLILNPTNAAKPLAVSRQRRSVTSQLTVVARTFVDRDNLLRLAAPGSPILISGPPQYGINDRYMSIADVAVDRRLSDHKFQVRIVQMPYVDVVRPAGPSLGVCGSRLVDQCDMTLAELAALGFSWDDLLRGRASSNSGPGLDNYRTWNDVLAEFADWNAVNDGTRTWAGVEVGD